MAARTIYLKRIHIMKTHTTTRPVFFCAVLILALSFPCASFAQNMAFELREDIKTRKTGTIETAPDIANADKTVAIPETQSSVKVVTLYPGGYSVREGDVETINDIAAKRQHIVNHKEKSYVTISNFAVPVFRMREKIHRLQMTAMVAKMIMDKKIDNKIDAVRPVDFDMILGSEKDSAKTAHEIIATQKDDKTLFTAGDAPLATLTPGKVWGSPDLYGAYKYYMVYAHELHPVIRNAVAGKQTLFKKLAYQHREIEKATLKSYEVGDKITIGKDTALPAIPTGYRRDYSNDEAVNAAIRRSLSEPAPDFNLYKRRIDSYVAAGNLLDAALAIFESTMVLNKADQEKMTPLLSAVLPAAMKDPEIAALVTAISKTPASRESLATSIGIIDKAREKSADFDHMLGVYAANHIRSVLEGKNELSMDDFKRLQGVRQSYVDAVTINPWLAGAYADLAAAHFAEFDTFNAWTLWDHARGINPDLPQLESVTGMEKRALNDFPEYF